MTTIAMPADRLAEIKALAKSRDVIGAVDKLGASLDSLDDATREATLTALTELAAARDLALVLDDARAPLTTRKNVLKAFRYLKSAKYTPAVVRALSNPDAQLRAEAALALSVFGAADAVPALVNASNDPSDDVRYYAADALGGVNTEAAKKAIAERLWLETSPTVLYALREASKRQSE